MPVDRGAIDAQLREIGEGDRWWEHREFRDLPHILHVDEQIRGIVAGKLLGARRPRIRPVGRWIIVATSLRLICLKQERFARKQVEVPAGQITGTWSTNRLRSYEIVLHTGHGRLRIRIRKEDAFRFSAALQHLLPAPAQALPGDATRSRIPGLDAIAALPGVSGIVAKVSGRPRPDYATHDHVDRLQTHLARVQQDVERLQQQVAFLEDLLQKRAEETFLQRTSADA